MSTRPIKINKWGLAEPVMRAHVCMNYLGREYLGEVFGVKWNDARGSTSLLVHHFNGEPWPIEPAIGFVRVIEPQTTP